MALDATINLTPAMKQYVEIKEKYPDCILFYRMGDFYEMFFEDALTAAPVLEITLTSRNKGKEDSVPLCGFPYHAASTYIAKLVEKGFKVAICEQVEDPKKAKGIVKREVIRDITTGEFQISEFTDRDSFLIAIAGLDFKEMILAKSFPDMALIKTLEMQMPAGRINYLEDECFGLDQAQIILEQDFPADILDKAEIDK